MSCVRMLLSNPVLPGRRSGSGPACGVTNTEPGGVILSFDHQRLDPTSVGDKRKKKDTVTEGRFLYNKI